MNARRPTVVSDRSGPVGGDISLHEPNKSENPRLRRARVIGTAITEGSRFRTVNFAPKLTDIYVRPLLRA